MQRFAIVAIAAICVAAAWVALLIILQQEGLVHSAALSAPLAAIAATGLIAAVGALAMLMGRSDL